MNALQKNAVTVKGIPEGETLLFAHGYGCNQDIWRFLTPYFADKYRIILFDHIGCGKSDARMYNRFRYKDLSGYALDLLDICEYLDVKNATLICHSVSCMIGVLAVNRSPSFFKKIVLIGPSPYFLNEGDYMGGFDADAIDGLISAMESNYVDWSGAITPLIMQNSDRPELTRELNDSFCAMDPSIAKDFARLTFTSDHRSDLPGVKIPTLVMQCSDDPIAPVFVGTYVHKNIKDSSLKQMKATGHCPHLSAPAETARVIQEFL